VAAGAATGQKNGAFGVGFGGFGVFFTLVNTCNNDSGSGFAFHDRLLAIYDLFGIFLMPVAESTKPEPEKYLQNIITQKHTKQPAKVKTALNEN
jgi:hypothetical protein